LAGLGLWRLRGRPRESLVCAALVASVLAVASAWPMWRGGWNPPARFLVPVLPALMVLTAAGLRGRLRAGPALLVGWGLWAGLAGGAEPRLVHRDRDGTAPLWRQTSGAVEWTRLLPGYVLADPDRHRLAAVWVGALVLAASAPGLASARNLGLAAAGLVAAATAADGLSQGRAGGREAVHVIGQPALRVPGWSVVAGEGRWGPGELGWGPVYEPHRFPEGAVFGSRLPLVPGCYRVEVDAEVLGDGVPWVRLRPEPGRVRLARLAGTPLQAQFEIAAGEHAVTLALEGGGPLTLRGVRLVRDTTATR
jgi:hypothetical protein